MKLNKLQEAELANTINSIFELYTNKNYKDLDAFNQTIATIFPGSELLIFNQFMCDLKYIKEHTIKDLKKRAENFQEPFKKAAKTYINIFTGNFDENKMLAEEEAIIRDIKKQYPGYELLLDQSKPLKVSEEKLFLLFSKVVELSGGNKSDNFPIIIDAFGELFPDKRDSIITKFPFEDLIKGKFSFSISQTSQLPANSSLAQAVSNQTKLLEEEMEILDLSSSSSSPLTEKEIQRRRESRGHPITLKERPARPVDWVSKLGISSKNENSYANKLAEESKSDEYQR